MPRARMRITGGTAKGIPLAEPRGHRLRPTTGLVREAMFNILGDVIEEARVLDLYAGTGALGVEALSRGAQEAVFVEANGGACQAILDSLARAGVADRGKVLRGKLPGALNSVEGSFDVIFLDPPYEDEGGEETLVTIASRLAEGGTVVYEHSSRYNPPQRPLGLEAYDARTYGDTAVTFYKAMEGA